MGHERGLTGPFFYRGFYGHPSVTCDMCTPEQRAEWRRTYKRLMRSFGYKSYQSQMKARKMLRIMMYDELGIKDHVR
jgi:hypothetical protein